MTSPPTAGPTVFGGRYAVERTLGSGATAVVYLCRDRTTTNAVALKVLHADLAESLGAERFLREIRLTSELDHPSILPVIDSGADGSQLYCVLPYMDGGSLRDVLREKKQLPIAEAVEIGQTIATALAYAHERGLIHRDIKPENILFHQGKAYLGDFGIARMLFATGGNVPTTTTGVIRGTPAYMSPEQASGERNYDGRSDIYSLGCVVYEMISGMPPFIGPTSQSVMAQRFSTTPREMRVYRGSVSRELDLAVAKAMAPAPADRHPTGRDFAAALATASRASTKSISGGRRLLVGAVALSVLAIAAVYAGQNSGVLNTAPPSIPDTTQLVVLPFEKLGDVRDLGSVDAMLYNAFSAWQGVSVVEPFRVRDAMSRQTASGVARDRSAALSLGAGRFIRGEIGILPAGGGWVIQAWLHQVGKRDTLLYHKSVTITPSNLVSVNRVYAGLASALLLRGRDSSVAGASTSLPAVQAFAAGLDSLDEWNLIGADVAFQHALDIDRGFATARFWQAQVRTWRRRSPEEWSALAYEAAADSARLPRRERQLALALSALGSGDFQSACAAYRRLTLANPTDFAAWFGLGQCRDLDFQIVSDARGGLRYRSSYQDAMRAYRQAFSVLAISHRGMQGGAFEPLRDLLFMRPSQLRRAISPSGRADEYIGRLDRDGDTLLMRVIPVTVLATGGPAAVPEHQAEAIGLQRDLFRQIVTTWARALPASAVAKEGVAISLEMRGDRSALDTLRVARRLAGDEATKLRLAVSDAILQLKHLDPEDDRQAVRIRMLADSLMRSRQVPTAIEAKLLAPLAVLVGHCGVAADFIALAPNFSERRIPSDIAAQAEALTMRRAMGCSEASASFGAIRARLIGLGGEQSPSISSLLGRAAKLTWPFDSVQLRSASATDYLARAQSAALRGDRVTARTLFASVDESRARTGLTDVQPDAIYVEARTLLALGDTAGAASRLDQLLDAKSRLTPGLLMRPVSLAALLRAMDLRSGLGRRRGVDPVQWRRRLATLWSNRDAGLALAPR